MYKYVASVILPVDTNSCIFLFICDIELQEFQLQWNIFRQNNYFWLSTPTSSKFLHKEPEDAKKKLKCQILNIIPPQNITPIL